MSPLPFSVEKMYHFITERFEGTEAAVQEQNLLWLQVWLPSLNNFFEPMSFYLRSWRHWTF
jgi:hypothetical protein